MNALYNNFKQNQNINTKMLHLTEEIYKLVQDIRCFSFNSGFY